MLHADAAVDVIRWFSDLTIDDIPLVGGKNASLGELVRALAPKGIHVPNGFAITADAFRAFLVESALQESIRATLADLDKAKLDDLQAKGRRIRQMILDTPLPLGLVSQIVDAYHQLSADSDEPIAVAVRSSATAEDLPDASFAGQQRPT